MKKILIAVAAVAVAIAVALGARKQFQNEPEATPAPAAGAQAAPAAGADGAVAGESAVASSGGAPEATEPAPGSGSDLPGPPPTASAPAPTRPSEPAPSAPAADALAIVRRAADVYQGVQSMRARFVQTLENPLLGSRTTSRGVLYQRRPDRFKLDFSDPEGDVIVSDGRYFWVYYPSVDERQVMRAPVSEMGAGGVDLQSQFVGDPARRFEAKLEGTEAVGGRKAHVVVLTPKQSLGYRRLKVWIDAQDHLIRRFQIVELNDNVRHFELSDLEIGARLADGIFRFTPPAGAQIVERG